MQQFVSVWVAIPLLCFIPLAQAQSAAPAPLQASAAPAGASDGLLTRVGRWLDDDWGAGWESGSRWRVMASPGTYHFSKDPLHEHVYLLGLERERSDGFVVGGTLFTNSFGQPSAYGYVGQRFYQLAGVAPLFAQVTGGIIYGYKPPFEKKVPLNYRGLSPAIIPAIGWQLSPALSVQVNFLGNAALMFQLSAEFQ